MHEQVDSELEVALAIREKLIPQAVRWYTGELEDDEEEYDEDGTLPSLSLPRLQRCSQNNGRSTTPPPPLPLPPPLLPPMMTGRMTVMMTTAMRMRTRMRTMRTTSQRRAARAERRAASRDR
jgi:hypothetical protein